MANGGESRDAEIWEITDRIWWCFRCNLRIVSEFMDRVTGLMAMPFSEEGNTGIEPSDI